MLTLGLMSNTLPRDSQSQEGVRCHRDGRCSTEPKGSALPWEGEASPHATPSPDRALRDSTPDTEGTRRNCR